jgi:hypothetical protein
VKSVEAKNDQERTFMIISGFLLCLRPLPSIWQEGEYGQRE